MMRNGRVNSLADPTPNTAFANTRSIKLTIIKVKITDENISPVTTASPTYRIPTLLSKTTAMPTQQET